MATFALEPLGLALAPVAAAALGLATVGLFAGVVIVITSYAVLAVRDVPTFGPPDPGVPPVAHQRALAEPAAE